MLKINVCLVQLIQHNYYKKNPTCFKIFQRTLSIDFNIFQHQVSAYFSERILGLNTLKRNLFQHISKHRFHCIISTFFYFNTFIFIIFQYVALTYSTFKFEPISTNWFLLISTFFNALFQSYFQQIWA